VIRARAFFEIAAPVGTGYAADAIEIGDTIEEIELYAGL
jgi:hypothetical protein